LLTNKPRFVVLDVEATGGNFPPERMMELGMIRLESNGEVACWESLFSPGRAIPPFVVKLTGITEAMVAEAPAFEECAAEIEAFTQNAWMVGHPVGFDYRFVQYEMRLAGYSFERPLLCTQELARYFLPGQESYSLGKLCRALGMETEGRHRALGDARLTAALFERIVEAALSEPFEHPHQGGELPERPFPASGRQGAQPT